MKKKVRVFTYNEFVKVLYDNGYHFRAKKGSHEIYTNGKEQISLPMHGKEIKKYLTNDLIKKYQLIVRY